MGRRRVYSQLLKRKVLLVDNMNCFVDVNLTPNRLHTIDLNATYWTGEDKLYVVDIVSESGPNPEKLNYKIL